MKKTELITDINEMSTEEKLLADAPKLTVAELIRILAPKCDDAIGDLIEVIIIDSKNNDALFSYDRDTIYAESSIEIDDFDEDVWLVDRYELTTEHLKIYVTVPQTQEKES